MIVLFVFLRKKLDSGNIVTTHNTGRRIQHSTLVHCYRERSDEIELENILIIFYPSRPLLVFVYHHYLSPFLPNSGLC